MLIYGKYISWQQQQLAQSVCFRAVKWANTVGKQRPQINASELFRLELQ